MSRKKSESILSSRRALLKAAGGCGLMTNTSLMATLLQLQAAKSAAAAATDTSGYKALVCLFLLGGNDSHNMVIPNEGDATSGEYGTYYDIRGGVRTETNAGGLAIAQSDLISITGPGSRSFGFHPGMAAQSGVAEVDQTDQTGVAGLYNTGKLAVAANVGSLLQPTDRTEYNNRSQLPLGLFSHADLQRHWQTGLPQSRSQISGWGGRMSDLLQSTNTNDTVSMNISVSGVNIWQTGSTVVPYAIGTGGATTVSGYYSDPSSTNNFQNRMYSRAVNNLFDQTYTDLLSKSFADSNRNSVDAALDFNAATSAIQLNTPFTSEGPSNHLKMVAKCIGARQQLGQTRQVFFVTLGGFDNHTNLITAHEGLMPRISRAVRSFYDATVELGVENEVTLFTASDFARTLSTNGQGSDHGWGGNHFVAGGAVNGGEFYGDYPDDLSTANPLNVGRGRYIPTMSVDELAADLALWFGAGHSDLATIIPNIGNFYDTGLGGSPLGLFGS